MLGLFFSEAMLFLVAALAGFAIGWRLRAYASGLRRRGLEEDVSSFRAALSEAQVRRARGPQ
jgi:hypothetical protein